MAYLDGSTVRQKVKQRPLKLDEALDIAIQAGHGLQAAHEKGIVHRDIKSANLMVNVHGQVKIMDFGLAQLAERSKLTKTATILGTPGLYVAGAGAAPTHRSPHRCLVPSGLVIYEMVTGRTPFEGEREQAVLYAIATPAGRASAVINQKPDTARPKRPNEREGDCSFPRRRNQAKWVCWRMLRASTADCSWYGNFPLAIPRDERYVVLF